MKKFNTKNSLLIYSAVLMIVFYLLPLLFKGGIAFLFLINPLAVFLSSIICSDNNKLIFPIAFITALLFLPTIFIFYNESAWIYATFYVAIAFVGCFIGSKKVNKSLFIEIKKMLIEYFVQQAVWVEKANQERYQYH